MACRYTYQGKTYEAFEFDDVLKAMSPAEASKYMPGVQSIPNAPMIGKTEAWVSLALKRTIKYAVDGGFDRIAMVTGEQSAERYDLSKQISKVEYLPHNSTLRAFDLGGNGVYDKVTEPDKIEDVIGKDAAKKLLESQPYTTGSGKAVHRLEGLDLKVGGEGMKAFYDKIVPQVANDVLKKLGGGKVGTVDIEPGKRPISYDLIKEPNHPRPWFVRDIRVRGHADVIARFATAEEARAKIAELDGKPQDLLTQPGFDITDKMREQAAQGMPLFQHARPTRASPSTAALSTSPETTALLRRLSVLESIRTCLG